MPLVFAANESSQREQNYNDVWDTEYEFPLMYRNLVTEGEQFIYYRGTKGKSPSGYFGIGIVGGIRDSAVAGRLICEAVDVVFFEQSVAIKDPTTDDYIEDFGPNRVHASRGVRRISDEQARRIIGISQLEVPAPEAASGDRTSAPASSRAITHGFAQRKETRDAIFRYSTDEVIRLLAAEEPAAVVLEMPHNNPGYDLLVEGGTHRYIEVKGTSQGEVTFFLSEGERLYSSAHAEEYALFVIYDIDLEARTHQTARFVGEVAQGRFTLAPTTYRVRPVLTVPEG